MENENELDFSEREFIGKENIRNDILNLLRRSKYGRNISQLSELLNFSRNTIKRYIDLLEEEDLVEIKEIGRSKIAYFKPNYHDNVVKGYLSYLMDFYNSILKGFKRISKELQNPQKALKEIGNEMGEHLNWPPLEDTDLKKIEKPTLSQVTDILIQLYEFFNSFYKTIKIEIIPPTKENISYKIIRIENISDKMEDSEYFYLITIGFFETKIRKICGDIVFFDIMEYQEENSCCYMKIEMR
ncbi:MAG: ArsR family transcriptional regulator [Candidatus Lokiarchaeota archaeon]|nr:ArsR family transcriptional regulator [Candidatus Lokiarchaeota archaeon]